MLHSPGAPCLLPKNCPNSKSPIRPTKPAHSCQCFASRSKKRLEVDLSRLQGLAKSAGHAQQQQQKRRQDETVQLVRSLASQTGSMSVKQLCRLAFILTALRVSKAVTKPVWQSVLRRILQASSAYEPSSSSTSSSSTSSGLELLLCSEAGPGDVLFLLRALAAWPDEAVAAARASGQQTFLNITAVAAAASSKAEAMTFQELMLSAVSLAQLRIYEPHLMTAASSGFVAAVAAVGSSSEDATTDTHTRNDPQHQQEPEQQQQEPEQQQRQQQTLPQQQQQQTLPQQHQQQQQQVLPQIKDLHLIINYLWANASLAHIDPLLLPAALQLLLTRGLGGGHTVSRSHLALCMWVLAALLVCHLQQQQWQWQLGEQRQQQLVAVVAAVHSMLAAQALQLWHSSAAGGRSSGSSSSSHGSAGGLGTTSSKRKQGRGGQQQQQQPAVFSTDSRRQMYQAHVWLQAAAAAAAAADGTSQSQHPREAAVVAPGLWPLSQLLTTAQQQQQQVEAELQLERFWVYCGSALASNTPQVSGLQQQVFQALQEAGLQPVMEFPAQPLPLTDMRQLSSSLAQQQQHGNAAAAGFLSVDIACAMPEAVVQLALQQGLKTALAVLQQQQQQQQQQRGSSHSTAGGVGTRSTDAGSSSRSSGGAPCLSSEVLVAVEVDGPTHAAVNSASHQLGATVCRNWLLQQWRWAVLVVPWWEWRQQPGEQLRQDGATDAQA